MTEATGIVGEFFDLKSESDADLLALQCGDFYEFFGEDAEVVGRELELKVTSKSSGGTSYPMAGVPIDDITPYLNALVERGYRVAVADQYEVDGGHAREIVRTVSPGTILQPGDAEARYLVGIAEDEGTFGLAFADVSTGRFLITDTTSRESTLSELYRFDPVEIVPGPSIEGDSRLLDSLRDRLGATVSEVDDELFAPIKARRRLAEHFGDDVVDRLPAEAPTLTAAGAVLAYVERTGPGVLTSMTRIGLARGGDHVSLDTTTQRNLELIEPMHGEGDGTLFETIDHTVTSPGRRLLKEWIQRPSRDVDMLQSRQDSVSTLVSNALVRETLHDRLDAVYDLERLATRATHGSASPRDLLAVFETLSAYPSIRRLIDEDPELSASPLASIVHEPPGESLANVRDRLEGAIREDPPSAIMEGGIFRRGHSDELDELIDRHESILEWFDGLADREKRRHDLSHVSVGRTSTDGYYIQVGRSVADDVPDHYEEVKSLKNSKRFRTDELVEKERTLLQIEDRRNDLEYDLFQALRSTVADSVDGLKRLGRTLARLDVLAAFATHAVEQGWVKPRLQTDGPLDIDGGRHPVVETTTEFVPNDCRLDDDRSLMLVTGPNMSGKSTYLRQVACITLLAQVGSFVPADSASIGVVDGIYTRVGALDELAQGRSTFMVEMTELSNILHSASADSLIILDEVGRGTATYDGISIAWAATEYLHNHVRSKTLFATHYHELTALGDHLPRVVNVHVAAEERDGDVTFLRTVREGPTDRSYGIHVASLADVPDPVVGRAREVLDRLRSDQAIEARGGTAGEPVQAVFDLGSQSMRAGSATTDGGDTIDARAGSMLPEDIEDVIDDLRSIDVEETPPIEMMNRVQRWQERLDDDDV